MRTLEELQQSWDSNEAVRIGWRRILETPEWKAASELAAAKIISKSRWSERLDGDALLARNLKEMNGGLGAIELLQTLWFSEPVVEPEVEDFSDEYMKKLQDSKIPQ